MKRIVIALAMMALAGCGVQRQSIRLDMPDQHVNPPDGQPIVLSKITDSRPPAEGLRDDKQVKNVGGVYRGGNGIAVDLDETVIDQTRQIVTQALRSMGYKVIDNDDVTQNIPRVEVNITTFHVALPFNFFRAASYSQQMIADIKTDVTVTGPSGTRSFKVEGHGTNIYQRVISENWEIALNKAISDYTQHFKAAMSNGQ